MAQADRAVWWPVQRFFQKYSPLSAPLLSKVRHDDPVGQEALSKSSLSRIVV